MSVVATINTNFTATTGELEKGTKRVQQAVKGTIAGITAGTFANLNSAISAVRGLVAFHIGKSIVQAIAGGVEKLDAVAKQAKNIGLAPDQFQSLGFAAEQSGSDAETLQRALGRMANKIAEAAGGSEEAQEVFKRLGLDFEQLRMMSTQGAFFKIIDAMNKTQDSFGKVESSIDIFSKAGVQLISTIVEGSRGVKSLQAEFEALHGKLTDLQFAGVELASDALGRVNTAFAGIKNQLVAATAPAVVLFSDALSNLTVASFRAAKSQFLLGEAYLELNKAVGDYLQELIGWIQRFRAAGNRGIANLANELIVPGHMRLAGHKAPFDQALSQVKKDALARAKIFDKSAESFEGAAKASDELDARWKKILRQMDELAKKNVELRTAVGIAGAADEHPSKAAMAAAAKAEKAFDKLSPGALERGSVGAANAIAAMKNNPVQLRQLKAAEEAAETLKRMERDLHDPKLVLAQSKLDG